MPVVDGDILKCVVFIDAPDAVIMNNVYHYALNDPTPDNPTYAQILSAVDIELSKVYNLWDDEMSTEYDVDRVEVDRVVWNAVDSYWEVAETIGSVVMGIPGLGISDACPHGCAANITFNTADPKRRARKFFPGISEDGIEDSTFSAGLLTVLANMGAEILSNQVVTGSADIVAGIPTNLGTWLPLAIALVNTYSAYQRRRKPGVGT